MSASTLDPRVATPAARVLSKVFRNYASPIELALWDGTRLRFGPGAPRLTLTFRDPRALRDLVLFRDPLRMARDFFRGRLDVEGNIYEVIGLKDHLSHVSLSVREKCGALADALRAHARVEPSERLATDSDVGSTRESIAFHYDVSNAFYQLWLDPEMIYSCAYFASPDQSLEEAQRRKLDLICRKLRLAPNERLLDIGCGWGGLVIWAARHYGVRAHGITLSQRQFDFARSRIAALGLGERASVELRDYRDLGEAPRFDKIASIGMFEHVGLKNLPGYFHAAHRLLEPGGLFLNHGITSREGGWRPTVTARFINRYVFPGGELDSIANIQRVMEACDFEVLDVHGLRPHYALTLRHWVRRLEAQREAAVREVGEATYRVWRLYMAGCALQFEQGETGVYQILLGKAGGAWPASLARGDLT